MPFSPWLAAILWAGAWLDALAEDARFAFRHLKRSPGFSIAALLTLTLGIGVNTATFSLLNTLVLKPLNVHDPDTLFAIVPTNSRGQERGVPVTAVEALADGPLDPLCGDFGGTVLPVTANGMPWRAGATMVTGRCFEVLGVAPLLGRTITEADAPVSRPGERVVVIGHRLWATAFSSSPSALGQAILVNGVDMTVIGVMPPTFTGLNADTGIDVIVPFDTVISATPGRRLLAYYLLGRLRPGVTLDQARAELLARWPAVLDAAVLDSLPESQRNQLRDTRPVLRSMGTGESRYRTLYARPVALVLGLTTVLVALAAINLGGLLLARQQARAGELAVRLALGGTRWRIARQILSEGVVLSLAGAALAVPVAYAAARLLSGFIFNPYAPVVMSLAPDRRVLAATALVAVGVSLVMCVPPIWLALRRGAVPAHTWDRTTTRTSRRWVNGLLIGQVALSAVLLAEALTLTRSLYRLQHSFGAVRVDDVLVARMEPRADGSFERGRVEGEYQQLVDRVAALPAVRAVALTGAFPRIASSRPGTPARIDGVEASADVGVDFVSPGFFEMFRIPQAAGRDFTTGDRRETRPVAILSETLARTLLPGGDPRADVVGRRLRVRSMPNDMELEIVGVVGDATQGNPRDPKALVVYLPVEQRPAGAFNPSLLIATGDPVTAASGVRTVVDAGGRDYVLDVVPMAELLARAPTAERLSATVAAGVAALGTALAFVGLYAAFAYAVVRRQREIGVRLALGATPARIARRLIGDGLIIAALGVALGWPLAVAAERALASLVFETSTADPLILALVAGSFVAIAIGAVLAPARRAARVDPATALRAE